MELLELKVKDIETVIEAKSVAEYLLSRFPNLRETLAEPAASLSSSPPSSSRNYTVPTQAISPIRNARKKLFLHSFQNKLAKHYERQLPLQTPHDKRQIVGSNTVFRKLIASTNSTAHVKWLVAWCGLTMRDWSKFLQTIDAAMEAGERYPFDKRFDKLHHNLLVRANKLANKQRSNSGSNSECGSSGSGGENGSGDDSSSMSSSSSSSWSSASRSDSNRPLNLDTWNRMKMFRNKNKLRDSANWLKLQISLEHMRAMLTFEFVSTVYRYDQNAASLESLRDFVFKRIFAVHEKPCHRSEFWWKLVGDKTVPGKGQIFARAEFDAQFELIVPKLEKLMLDDEPTPPRRKATLSLSPPPKKTTFSPPTSASSMLLSLEVVDLV